MKQTLKHGVILIGCLIISSVQYAAAMSALTILFPFILI